MTDTERMDALQLLLLGADFRWGDPAQPVLLIALPKGAGVSADLRATVDRMIQALRATPTERETPHE